jgi:hypothetical protein
MSCALYLCCLIVAGYPLATGLARRANWIERTALTVCLGPAVLALLLIFLSMAGVRPVESEILAISAALAIAATAVWKRGPGLEQLEPTDRPAVWWRICCYAGIGYGLYAIGKDVFIEPVIEWDAFSIWQLKAQVLAILPLHPRPMYFSNVNLNYSHLRYPLLVPMASAGMHAMTGRLDDWGKLIAAFWYLGMCLAVYASARRLNGATAALTATALLACLAPISHFGGSGTAEMAITAMFACSVVCILLWRESQRWGYVILAGLLGAMMAWTKNDGIGMAAVNVIVVAFTGKNWKRSLTAALLMAVIGAALYAPWPIYIGGLPKTDENYAERLNPHNLAANAHRLWDVLAGFGWELLNWRDWGLFWIILAVLTVLESRRFANGAIRVIGALMILHLALYVPVFMVTNWNLDELMPVTLGRLFMHFAPAGAILIGAFWPQWLGVAKAEREAGLQTSPPNECQATR